MWKEKAANLKANSQAIAAEKESMRPSFKKEPWMDPAWRDTGPKAPEVPPAGMTSAKAPMSVEPYPKDGMSIDDELEKLIKPKEDDDELEKLIKPFNLNTNYR